MIYLEAFPGKTREGAGLGSTERKQAKLHRGMFGDREAYIGESSLRSGLTSCWSSSHPRSHQILNLKASPSPLLHSMEIPSPFSNLCAAPGIPSRAGLATGKKGTAEDDLWRGGTSRYVTNPDGSGSWLACKMWLQVSPCGAEGRIRSS